MKPTKYAVLSILVVSSIASAKMYEDDYNRKWCSEHGGKAEVVLPDRTRADCVTPDHAIEADYAKKWYQAVGQSLWYGFQLNKRAGILLIVDPKDNKRYLYRLNSMIDHYALPIDVWTINK